MFSITPTTNGFSITDDANGHALPGGPYGTIKEAQAVRQAWLRTSQHGANADAETLADLRRKSCLTEDQFLNALVALSDYTTHAPSDAWAA